MTTITQGATSFREDEIFQEHYHRLTCRTDRMFAGLFVFQWILGIIFALTLSSRTWAGSESNVHIHVYAAIFLGGLVGALPIFLILTRPGATLNRYVISVAQILFSILFIHLTGGRIETHFHVFGSLAFLAFYRDYRPVVIATIVTALDHLIRGSFWPESVYGVLFATPWRAMEHAAWVVFEDFFLIISMKMGRDELHAIAHQQSQLEVTVANVEKEVENRTEELRKSHKIIVNQQRSLISSAKMTALGEMAAGIAHEINNPLAIIQGNAGMIKTLTSSETVNLEMVRKSVSTVEATVKRIAKIVQGLRSFARDGSGDSFALVSVKNIVEETLALCKERFRNHSIQLEYDAIPDVEIECRAVQISQVLLNLIVNSFDAVSELSVKWVRVQVVDKSDAIEIHIMDSGPGIPEELRDKVMQPFFTTKEIGKGTGLGLSISQGLIEAHGGMLYLDVSRQNTCFVVRLLKRPKINNNNTKGVAA